MIDWVATPQGGGKWLITWASTTDLVYEVWLDGVLLGTVTATGASSTYLFTGLGYTATPPHVEVHDVATGKAENEEYPPYAVLQWRGLTGCAGYVVERLNGTWATVYSTPESGSGWYSYTTPALADDTETNFRVKAVDQKGVAGDAVEFSVTLTRNPVPPVVSFVIDSGDLVAEAL